MWGAELTLNLFGVTILGSVIVVTIVTKLKQWLKTEGWINTLLALIVGTALGALVYGLEFLAFKLGMIQTVIPIVVALLDGFFSGGVAAGLWKTTSILADKAGPKVTNNVTTGKK